MQKQWRVNEEKETRLTAIACDKNVQNDVIIDKWAFG